MRFLVVAVGAVMFVAASPTADQSPQIQVEEVASTIGDPAAPFGTIDDMLEIAPGIAAVTDDFLKTIHLWNLATGEVSTLAGQGHGPGEVQVPTQLARRPGGGFAVYDIGYSAVLLFSNDLRYERLVRVPGIVSNPKDLLVFADGSFILAGGQLSNPRHLHLYSAVGESQGDWGDPLPQVTARRARVQVAGGALRRLDGAFLFAVAAPLEIFRFEGRDFSQPTRIVTDFDLLPEPTDETLLKPGSRPGSTAFQWWFDRATAVFLLPGNQFLHIVTRFYRRDSVWSLFDSNGELLARRVVARAYDVYDRMQDGRVLASYRENETDERVAVVLDVVVDQ